MQALTNAIENVIGLPDDWQDRSQGGRLDYLSNNTNERDILAIYREAFTELDGASNQRLNKGELCTLLGVLMQEADQ